MKLSHIALAGAAALAFSPAQAAPLLVTITGDAALSFEIHSQPTPFYGDEFGELFVDVPLSYTGGGGSLGDVAFYSDLIGGGLSILPYTPGGPLVLATGLQFYSVTGTDFDAPTILPGVYQVTDDVYNLTYTVTIASVTAGVPEPTSWALMIGGLGLAGFALRGRRAWIAFAPS